MHFVNLLSDHSPIEHRCLFNACIDAAPLINNTHTHTLSPVSADLMTLLPKELLSGIESGELELDFEALDNDTLQKIDMWLRQLYPDAEGQQPQQPVQPVGICVFRAWVNSLASVVSGTQARRLVIQPAAATAKASRECFVLRQTACVLFGHTCTCQIIQPAAATARAASEHMCVLCIFIFLPNILSCPSIPTLLCPLLSKGFHSIKCP